MFVWNYITVFADKEHYYNFIYRIHIHYRLKVWALVLSCKPHRTVNGKRVLPAHHFSVPRRYLTVRSPFANLWRTAEFGVITQRYVCAESATTYLKNSQKLHTWRSEYIAFLTHVIFVFWRLPRWNAVQIPAVIFMSHVITFLNANRSVIILDLDLKKVSFIFKRLQVSVRCVELDM